MKISKYGLEFIKKEEGFIPKAYWDYKQYSIGYGSGKYVNGNSVKEGDVVTEEEATAMLESWINKVVEVCIKKYVVVSLSQNRYDSLCSFIYNVGNCAFETSTLLKLLNQNKILEAAAEFDRWIYAGGKISDSLVKRRKREKELFLK
ncbi:MAG: lysozyme [Fusobacteriaceae bacterium]